MHTIAALAFLATTVGAAWRLAAPHHFRRNGRSDLERSGVSILASKASC